MEGPQLILVTVMLFILVSVFSLTNIVLHISILSYARQLKMKRVCQTSVLGFD